MAVWATQQMDGLASIDDLVAEEFNRYDAMPPFNLSLRFTTDGGEKVYCNPLEWWKTNHI